MQPPYPNQPYPPQPPQYGRPPMASQPYGPPPQQPPKKSGMGLVLGIVGGSFLLLVVGGAVAGYFFMRSSHSSLPLDAKQLPAQTREIHTAVIDGVREPNKRVKAVYLAAELGQHFCGGRGDPAAHLETLGSLGPHSAKEFFDPANLDKVRAELQCGGELAKSLDDDRASFLVFDDEDSDTKSSSYSGKHYIKIGHFKMKAPPAGQGFTSVSFGALPGFCQTTPPSFTLSPPTELGLADAGAPDAGAGATTTSCGDKSYAAFAVGNTWFFGNKASLDELSKGVVVPKANVGSRISALQDAVAQTSNLSQVSLVAEPKSSKEFLEYPCEWAVSQIGYSAFSSSYGSGSLGGGSGSGSTTGTGTREDFMGQCFPAKADSKLIEEIDAKLRAVAFETDPDYVQAGAITGNIVLVTRDAEAAKDAERDVKELVGDWKSQIELNAPKLIKKAKEKASSPREKKFADIADTYFQALSTMKVSRSDRSIKISYKASFTKEDRQELEDEDKSSDDKRLPVVDVLEAIRDKKPMPQASLAKLVGPTWAAYLVLPPLPPKAPSPKVTLTAAECRSLQSKLQSIKIGDIPSDASHAYLDQKYATCDLHPPEVTEDQRTCLAAVVTATDYGKCVSTDTTDPRQPPESEYGTKKKDKGSEL
ncbi:MAG TPA: hypothetical protein VLM85_27175 [Polyangiaceae bacterium]|nr:hypothetical protein [Polyangiaceae bacterium]